MSRDNCRSQSDPRPALQAVVGLGNPGPRYRKTRHNLGFQVVERLAEELAANWKFNRSFSAWTARAGGWILVKPDTYVNLSGRAVRAVLEYYALTGRDLVVAVDDVNLPPGTIRIREGGGAGGHHGLESIIGVLGGKDFIRIRIGAGGGDLADLTAHVLSRPGRAESALYETAVADAAQAVRLIRESGPAAAMNIFNRREVANQEEVSA